MDFLLFLIGVPGIGFLGMVLWSAVIQPACEHMEYRYEQRVGRK